jgi:hypothetical protein
MKIVDATERMATEEEIKRSVSMAMEYLSAIIADMFSRWKEKIEPGNNIILFREVERHLFKEI